MSRYGEKQVVPLAKIKQFADRLVELGDYFQDVIKQTEKDGIEKLTITHFKTGLDGIDKLSKLAGAVHAAHWKQRMGDDLTALREGEPYEDAVEIAVKPRGRKKKKDG